MKIINFYKKTNSKFYKLILIVILFSYLESYSNHTSDTINLGYKKFKLIGEITRYDNKDKNYSKTKCDKWKLNKLKLTYILTKMKQVSSSQWNALCYTYPCYYEGNVINNNEKYKLIVNGASHIKIINDKETLYFILEKANSKFIIPCNCCE